MSTPSLSTRPRFEAVADLLRPIARPGGRLLDVGCRDGVLRDYLPAGLIWEGFDLVQNATGSVTHLGDMAAGLPFPDREFDLVAALDVIEHTDDLHRSLEECWRVARLGMVIALPNIAHLEHRLRFLIAGRMGDKYDLRPAPTPDRHRWLTVQPQADALMAEFARRHGAALETVWQAQSPRQTWLAHFGKAVGLPASLWTFTMLYRLTRDKG
jgi:SAM-dependent methyltransferase